MCVTNSAGSGLGWGSRKPHLAHLGTFSVLSGVDMWGLNFELHLSGSLLYHLSHIQNLQKGLCGTETTTGNLREQQRPKNTVQIVFSGKEYALIWGLFQISRFRTQKLWAQGKLQIFTKNKTATMA